jgi:hypothetical protein
MAFGGRPSAFTGHGLRSNRTEITTDHEPNHKEQLKMGTTPPLPEPKKRLFSLDTWAVLLALAAALLIRAGLLTHVPW